MFENDLAELSTPDLLESAAAHRAEADRLEARLLEHAQHYADHHHPTSRRQSARADAGAITGAGDGRERSIVLGGEGCPPIAEFAPAEFGVMLGISPGAAADYIGQALALRHRLPLTWARVQAGQATPWKARKIATACLDLPEQAARAVDHRVSRIVDTLTPIRLDKIVEAAKKHADPDAARRTAEEKARERGVYLARSDDHGTKKIYIRTATGHAIRFDARITSIAEALKILGDTSPLQRRRADAIGIIADPRYTEELLHQAHHHLQTTPPPTEAATADSTAPQAAETAAAASTARPAAEPATTDDTARPAAETAAAASTARPAAEPVAADNAAPLAAEAATADITAPATDHYGDLARGRTAHPLRGKDTTTPGAQPSADAPAAQTRAMRPDEARAHSADSDPASGSTAIVDPAHATRSSSVATRARDWPTPSAAPDPAFGRSTATVDPAHVTRLSGPAMEPTGRLTHPGEQHVIDRQERGPERTENGARWADEGPPHAWTEPSPQDEADRDAPHPSNTDLPDPLDAPYAEAIEPFDPALRLGRAGDTDDDAEPLDTAARRALDARLAQIRHAAHTIPRTGRQTRPGQTQIYIHLTDHTLATGNGVLRVEDLGPLLATQLTELIGHGPYTVKPVIDLNDAVSVDAYEIPDRIRERVKLIHPVEVFPYGTRETHATMDLDHIQPYDPQGPPGQTNTANLAPLRRFPHRLKTHGHWKVRRLDHKTLEWNTPYGFTFHVNPTGTHRVPQRLPDT